MEISLKYFEKLKQGTKYNRPGSVSIDSSRIPVNFKVRKYSHRDRDTGEKKPKAYAYFSSEDRWLVRIHMEPEELDMVIRKLEEARERL